MMIPSRRIALFLLVMGMATAPAAISARAADKHVTADKPVVADKHVVRDALGVEVSLVTHPVRVVTLVPSLGELAADLVGEELERIVGVSELTDYPPALKKATSIGRYDRFNIERVLGLKPDLVLATTDGNHRDQIERLRELKIPVVVVSTRTFDEVSKSMILVGDALGEKARGEQSAARFREGLSHLGKEAAKSASHPSVMLQVGTEPLVVVGGSSFLNEALELLQAKNIYGDRKEGYPRPSLEDAVHRNPEQILVLAMSPDDTTLADAVKAWDRFPNMKAVKGKRVMLLKADALIRPSLRLLEGLSLLNKALRGETRERK